MNQVSSPIELWRALAVFRIVTLGYAMVSFVFHAHAYRRPGLAVGVLVMMAVWTGLVWHRQAHRPPWLWADAGVTLASVLMCAVVQDPRDIGAGLATLPTVWAASAVIAWSIEWGWRGGLVMAAGVLAADLVVTDPVNTTTIHNGILLALAGVGVGLNATWYGESKTREAKAAALSSAAQERLRLTREFHDSVLQVLAFVQRRGRELGGAAQELADLAGAQEKYLRQVLVAGVADLPPTSLPIQVAAVPDGLGNESEADKVDICEALRSEVGADAHIAAPAGAISVRAEDSRAMVAAVKAAVQNAHVHGGADVGVWVLVDLEPEALTIEVRDNGKGCTDAEFVDAEQRGRLGVSQSIRGRTHDLGGMCTIVAKPGTGVHVTLRFPKHLVAG